MFVVVNVVVVIAFPLKTIAKKKVWRIKNEERLNSLSVRKYTVLTTAEERSALLSFLVCLISICKNCAGRTRIPSVNGIGHCHVCCLHCLGVKTCVLAKLPPGYSQGQDCRIPFIITPLKYRYSPPRKKR